MKIKIKKQRVSNQSILKPQLYNPELKCNSQVVNGIVFQSQYNSFQNYFSLLHHIFGRDGKAKKNLQQASKQEGGTLFSKDIHRTSIKNNYLQEALVTNVSQSTLRQVQASTKRQDQNHYKYDTYRPKWKDSILRRKNNGSHGEIMKGNPKDNHSRLMNRIIKTEEPIHQPSKVIEKLIKQDFVPLGNMHKSNKSSLFPFNSLDIQYTSKLKPKFMLKPRINRRMTPKRQKKIGKSPSRASNENQAMSKTCFPLKNSLQLSDSITIRKTIVSTPYRYKSRLSTPCAWQYTSHR